jgi:hypothetical protein
VKIKGGVILRLVPTSVFRPLDIFFSMFPYTHVGNIFFVNNTPYESMFNDPYNAIFFGIICWGLFLFTWKIFIRSNTVFPPLLNTILLVGLDVLIEIIQDFLKCYL